MTTIKDVAREANVSVSTVSMVLSNGNYSISNKTRKKVIEAADKLKYVPNEIARSLVSKKTRLVALMVPDITNPFFPEIARTVSYSTIKRNYNLLLINTEYNTQEKKWSDILNKGMIEGAFIVSRSSIDKDIKEIVSRKIPMVTLDEPYAAEEDNEFLVTGDNELGGYLAGKHLIELNHRKLACITGPLNTQNSSKRLEGFYRACVGIVNKEDICIANGDYSFEGGYRAAKELLDKDFTAIFCFNDVSAYGAMKAIKEAGKNIPEDISIIGYDNINMTSYTDPSLTTIDQFTNKIAEKAANLLLDLIEGKEINEKQILIEPELISRDSTKKIRR